MPEDNSLIQTLCGLKVQDIRLDNDGVWILFQGGSDVVFHNELNLVGFVSDDVNLLIGRAVANITEGTDLISVEFDNKWQICVDMRDDAYRGPEALELNIPGQPIVIWN